MAGNQAASMLNFSRHRLGRLPHDQSRVSVVKAHVAAEAPPPLSLPRTEINWIPSLVQNDTLPTCSIAGLINSARMWALLHGFDLENTEAAELAFYAMLAGCVDTEAAIAATDGLVLLDVLDTAHRMGFDVGVQAPLVPEFSAIHLPDMAGIRDAIYTKGSTYVGVTLYEADMQLGAVWSGGTEKAGAQVGGHCIDLVSYTPDGFGAATWGQVVQVDNEWLSSRMDEAFALTWTLPIAA